MKIISNNISIVVQGAVTSATASILDGLRAVFPGAELILSTWEGSDINGLTFDKVVLSPDPGAQLADEVANTPNNVNRQIVSSRAGIQAASRPFILKTRTDIVIRSAGFLDYWGVYDDNAPSYLFKNRLLICNYYTRNPGMINLCFHPSDWLIFGNAEDLRMYFEDIPLQTDETALWFKTHAKSQELFTNLLSRFTPEQYLFTNFLRRFCPVDINCYYDCTPELARRTEELFANCFVVLDYQKQLDIYFIKYRPNRYLEKHTLVSHRQWETIYRHYCYPKTFSPRWMIYCCSKPLYRFLYFMRKRIVNALDAVGLKETVKAILRKVKR